MESKCDAAPRELVPQSLKLLPFVLPYLEPRDRSSVGQVCKAWASFGRFVSFRAPPKWSPSILGELEMMFRKRFRRQQQKAATFLQAAVPVALGLRQAFLIDRVFPPLSIMNQFFDEASEV